MATTTFAAVLHETAAEQQRQATDTRGFGPMLVTLLTLLAVAIGGYHPYSEDGGLYMAGIKQVLNPALYPHGSEFVAGHLPFSLFVPGIAAVVHVTHLRLPVVIFGVHLATWWLTLLAAWMLARRCFHTTAARCGAVGLFAVWLTLPVAGTSLMLMDPYLTARSISTPCALLALAGALDFGLPGTARGTRRRGLVLCLVSLAASCAMHLLMGVYAVGAVLLLLCMLSRRPVQRVRRTMMLCAIALTAAAIVQWMAPAEGANYLSSAMTRSYWFIGRWQWYEQFGLVAPLAILAYAGMRQYKVRSVALAALAQMALAAGLTGLLIALLFAHPALSSHLIARLQPLRIFQVVYAVMILMVGAFLGERLLRQSALRWVSALVLLGGVMLYAQRQTYPNSEHFELPGRVPSNLWVRAFLWIRSNTPLDATFAIDAHYIGAPGEDAQTFRAIAERSVLPDYSKDGGEAAISPAMSSAWTTGVQAQTDLGYQSDAMRLAHLRPLGVGWLVLERKDATAFSCPYENAAVKVCQLP